MAGPFKTIITFQSAAGSGWQEVWYRLGSADIEQAGFAAEGFCSQRSRLLGKGSFIESWDVTDVTQERLTLQRDGTQPPFVSNKFPTDRPASGHLGRCTCLPNRGARQFWMRGIPDDWVVYDPEINRYTLVGEFAGAFLQWQGVITSGNWGIRVLTTRKQSVLKGGLITIRPQPVTGYAELTLVPGNTLPPGQPIVISGFRKDLAHLNGTYLYPAGYARVADVIVLNNRFLTPVQVSSYVGGGYARVQEFAYNAVRQCNYSRPGGHRTGKIIGVERGRR